LAVDLGSRNITVNAVLPGWFASPLASAWQRDDDLQNRIVGHTVLGRWGEAHDLPGIYLFLASGAAAFVTGTTIPVDGGYLLV
jgi:gluconate 5-dehydrogenase